MTLFEENIINMVGSDVAQIYHEQDGQDGMYSAEYGQADGLHRGDNIIERIIRDEESDYPVRIYVLSVSCGGVCILGYSQNTYRRYEPRYTIFHLSEDDGNFFIHSDGLAGFNYMNKLQFVDMVGRAISLLNNIK